MVGFHGYIAGCHGSVPVFMVTVSVVIVTYQAVMVTDQLVTVTPYVILAVLHSFTTASSNNAYYWVNQTMLNILPSEGVSGP